MLYVYESVAGYGLLILRICGWILFVYGTAFTVKYFLIANIFNWYLYTSVEFAVEALPGEKWILFALFHLRLIVVICLVNSKRSQMIKLYRNFGWFLKMNRFETWFTIHRVVQFQSSIDVLQVNWAEIWVKDFKMIHFGTKYSSFGSKIVQFNYLKPNYRNGPQFFQFGSLQSLNFVHLRQLTRCNAFYQD